jgi:peptidoglycan-N-acetylglucosamine deacetylase
LPASNRRVQASINIDLDTLCEELDEDARLIRMTPLRAITYQRVLPRFLELLDRLNLKATFFIIGRDVAPNAALVRTIAAAGHELANHTMNHPKQLVRLSEADLVGEIRECGEAIHAVTGVRPTGFRAPGYTVSPAVLTALRGCGYTYDSSLNASWVYLTLKRLFKAIRLNDQEFIVCQPYRDTTGPRNPYFVADRLSRRQDDGFIEIPVSIVPYIHYPFVTSVLLQLGLPFTLWCLRRLVGWQRFVNCNLHINEFTDRSDVAAVDRTFYFTHQYAAIDLSARMRYFETLFTEMQERCDIVLLRDVRP